MKDSVLFLIKFFIIFAFLHTILLIVDLSIIENAIAEFGAGMYGLGSTGNRIILDGQSFVIVPSCTGLVSSIVLASIVFALKKPELEKKFLIFIVGSVLLMIMNLFRVLFVLWFAIGYGAEVAEIVHVISWFFVAIVVIALWFVLTKRVCKIENFRDFI